MIVERGWGPRLPSNWKGNCANSDDDEDDEDGADKKESRGEGTERREGGEGWKGKSRVNKIIASIGLWGCAEIERAGCFVEPVLSSKLHRSF